MVPANTVAPARLSTGMLSPVSSDSSTADSPSVTSPSTGMRSPGRTTTRSPTRTSSTGDLDLDAVAQHARHRRLQIHQLADGLAGLPARPRLQRPAEQDQRDDHGRGFVVDVADRVKMPNQEIIREIAGRAWSEVLRERSQELAGDVARRMAAELTAQNALPKAGRSRQLREGAALISASRTQVETLEALLTAAALLTPACGVLVLRGTQAGGWNCVGLTAAENFKRMVLDCTHGTAGAVVSSCAARTAKAGELDTAFAARLGLESARDILLLPVLLKERVAALLLAVSGSAEDLAELEVLVQLAQLALELHAYRKSAAPAEVARQAASAPVPTDGEPPRAAASAAPVTTAGYVPADAAAPAEPYCAYAPISSSAATAPPVEIVEPGQAAAPPVDESHDRARRFAKLLVEEIKLYNQAKVSEGRSHSDLYSRLREDIEKSRSAYQKRYSDSVKDVDYFTQELVRILADNNRSVLGADFPG